MRQGGNRQTEKLLMERSVPGRVGVVMPNLDVPAQPLPNGALLRDDLLLPELSEPEVVQYFTGLSLLNFSIDTQFYPLGSCTMKYNPKVNDEVAFFPGFSNIHPLQPEAASQGALELLYRLQGFLTEITGMHSTSMATLAGAHGELAGVLMIRAYHQDNGDTQRTKMAIPDSAHGTNPASAAMGGFDMVPLPSDRDGNIDGDPSRLHYCTDGVGDNAKRGLVRDISRELGGTLDTEPIDFMTAHVDAYRQLADPSFVVLLKQTEQRLTDGGRYFVPQDRIEEVAERIQDGDIIAATSTVRGLDVAHTGLALWVDGTLHMLHAPLVGEEVQISALSLADRIRRIGGQDGIIVARPRTDPETIGGMEL